MKFRNLILPLALVVIVLFNVTTCYAADGSEFVGTWICGNQFVKIEVQISHNSGNQYFVAMSMNNGMVQGKSIAFYRDGMLIFSDTGKPAVIDRRTGNLNLDGEDCPRKK